MGHSLETLLNTYTHVIKDLAGQGRVSADTLIADARGAGMRRRRSSAERAVAER
jgi:hypothetical protein